MTTQRNSDEIRTRVLTENTAQGVLNQLKALESNRAHMRTRWIWELLQNARDTSVDTDTDLVASIEHKPGELVFQHNGPRFKIDEIAHLIYHGSTKVEDPETIGQYGSGFLTTHLLSPEINISGQLDDGQSFAFRLKREIGSVQELSESMDRAWDEFNASSAAPSLGDFTTRFRYPIKDDATDAVNDGLAMLKRCAPFVVVFNENFSRIDIETPDGTTSFEVTKRTLLSQVGLQEIKVSENENGNENSMVYLMAKSEKTSVAIPLELVDGTQVCLSVNRIPKIFLGFPIVGTENFSFPAVINSFKFTPTEERDGIFLGRNETDKANIDNQVIIEEACKLLICLLRFVASSGWHNTYTLINIPPLLETYWLNPIWLQDTLKEHLIKKIRQTPAVITEDGDARAPEEARLPLADTDAGVKALWDLLDGWQGGRAVLPRRNEAIGWCNAIKNWAMISECEVSSFYEVIDGCKLASRVEEISYDSSAKSRTHRLSLLDLKKDISAINWLDQLIAFLKVNGLSEVINQYRIVPSQEGFLRTFPNLRCDQDIAEELKDIAELLEWRVRPQLRDKLLTALDDEVGAERWDNDYIFGQLIKRLQERAEKNPDDNFTQASARLFAWIVEEKNWDLLGGFPMFAEEIDSDKPTVIYLPRTADDGERPLAPVRAWSEDLQRFSDLFPLTRILGDDFFEKVPDSKTWRVLAEQGFVRTNIVITNEVNFNKFYPDHPLREEVSHKTDVPVTVTDIVGRVEIIEDVRDSQSRARRFWYFLTEWLVQKDRQALEIKEAKCQCGETHRYFPAEWIEPLRERNWVRLGDKRHHATAQSLASLLRGSGWELSSLNKNPDAVKLLEAIDVNLSDLRLEFITENDEERNELVNSMTELHHATQGNLNQIRALVQHLKEDQERKHIVDENRRLGQKVEKLVKAILEKEGFSVKRTGIGSDFEISEDIDDITTLDIAQEGQSWLIEVKSTQTENDNQSVRMSSKQAQTAVEKRGEFLLCVVPIGSENTEPDLETVKGHMRFIKNIHQKLGSRVATLCESIEEQEEVLSNTPDDTSSGVDLDFEAGKAGIRVANFVWEDEGFQLKNLAEQLKQVKTT